MDVQTELINGLLITVLVLDQGVLVVYKIKKTMLHQVMHLYKVIHSFLLFEPFAQIHVCISSAQCGWNNVEVSLCEVSHVTAEESHVSNSLLSFSFQLPRL